MVKQTYNHSHEQNNISIPGLFNNISILLLYLIMISAKNGLND